MGKHTCAAVALSLALASCTTPSALRTDTEAYINTMATWAPVEAETARTLERILATQFVEPAEVLRQIGESSPRIERHLDEIRQYHPRTPELRRIHEVYAGAWRTLLDGYASIDLGLATNNQKLLAAGRQSLLRWRTAILEVARELRDLSDRLGLPAAAGGP